MQLDKSNSSSKTYFLLHFIVLILSFTAILGKLIETSALSVVFFRTFFAALGLGLILYFSPDFKKSYDRKGIWKLVGVGAIIGIHWICFFGSAKVSTVSVSLVIFSTTSFFTSILEPLIRKQAINPMEIFLGIGVTLGVYLIFTFESQYTAGILIGIIGALLAAIFSILNSKLTNEFPLKVLTFYELLGAFLVTLVLIPLVYLVSPTSLTHFFPSRQDILWILVLGLGCTVGPYLGMAYLLRKISAFTLNLSINMEPVYGIILAFVIFGESEKMTSGFYWGSICILLTLLIHPLWNKYQKNKSHS
ncbi:MAG: DMT family transporter [Spirosomataceae bacterium]